MSFGYGRLGLNSPLVFQEIISKWNLYTHTHGLILHLGFDHFSQIELALKILTSIVMGHLIREGK